MTQLIPVSEWIFNLYRVTYHYHENDEIARHTRHLVSIDRHAQGEILETEGEWPSEQFRFARWELIKENVVRPKQIGVVHGMRLDESGWSAGERLKDVA